MADNDRDDEIVTSAISQLEALNITLERIKDTSDVDLIRTQAELARISLEINHSKLKDWAERWKVDPKLSSPVLFAFWGSEGLDAVRSRLQDCNKSLEKAGRSARNELQLDTKDQKPLDDFKHTWTVIRRKTSVTKKSSTSATLQSAQTRQHLARMSDLRHDITWLNTRIDEICTVSDMAFEATQNVVSTPVRQSTTDIDGILHLASKRREAAIELYRYCRKWETDICLDLDMLGSKDNQKESDTDVKFHVYRLNYMDRCFEQVELLTHEFVDENCSNCGAIFEGGRVIQHTARRPVQLRDGTSCQGSSAVATVQIPTIQVPTIQISDVRPSNQTQSWNSPAQSPKARNNARSRDSRQLQFEELRIKRQDSSTKSIAVARYISKAYGMKGRSLDQQDRIRLAYQIAFCSLFLMDTPWLSGLDDESVRVLSTSSEHAKFGLQIQSEDLDDRFEIRDAPLTGPSHVFKIGVLLVGIAVGKSLDYDDDEVSSEPILLLPAVERVMGPQYRDAAAFCLNRGRIRHSYGDRGRAARESFLQEFYVETVQRLLNLLHGIGADFDNEFPTETSHY